MLNPAYPANIKPFLATAQRSEDGWIHVATGNKGMKIECLFFFNDRPGVWEITCAERCWSSGEWEQLWRYISAPATESCGDGAITETPHVCVNTHRYTSMGTGWTAVFGQSNLAGDLPHRGPAQFFVNSYPPWLQSSTCRFVWWRPSSYLHH